MKLLDFISIPGEQGKRIEILQGDLTRLLPEEAFDLLLISAFPNDYTPTKSSLIGSLFQRGLSIASLAMNKDIDLRETFSCWLSRELKFQQAGLYFKRVICFEPLIRGKPPELVGDIFRALTPILAERPDIKTLGCPVIAAGDQGYSVGEMLVPFLQAAFQWLKAGLPLNCVKIVVRSEVQAKDAFQIFAGTKKKYSLSPPASGSEEKNGASIMFSRSTRKDKSRRKKDTSHYHRDNLLAKHLSLNQLAKQLFEQLSDTSPDHSVTKNSNLSLPFHGGEYDVFISYSRADKGESEILERALRELQPNIRIFVDRKEINIGAAWQPEIFENIDRCRKVVALLSPNYLSSKMCKEEFNIAWIRSRENNEDVIFPIYLYTAGLPTYMRYRNYFDCREGDKSKIVEASKKLLDALKDLKD